MSDPTIQPPTSESNSEPTANAQTKAAVEAIPDAPAEDLSYKSQLDKVALETKFPEKVQGEEAPHPIVQKINEYTPALGKMLGVEPKKEEKPVEQEKDVPGPPNRPQHDEQVKEFVRDQHRSRPEDTAEAIDQ